MGIEISGKILLLIGTNKHQLTGKEDLLCPNSNLASLL